MPIAGANIFFSVNASGSVIIISQLPNGETRTTPLDSITLTGNTTFTGATTTPTVIDSSANPLAIANVSFVNTAVQNLTTNNNTWAGINNFSNVNSSTINSSNIISTDVSSTNLSSTAINSTNIISSTINSTNLNSSSIISTDVSSINLNSSTINSSTINSSTINSSTINSTNINSNTLNSSVTNPYSYKNSLSVNASGIWVISENDSIKLKQSLQTLDINSSGIILNTNNLLINSNNINVQTFNQGLVHSDVNGLLSSSLLNINDIPDGLITNAKLNNASVNPIQYSIVLRDSSGYLYSVTSDLSDSTTKVATTEYVTQTISNLKSGVDPAYDTLLELQHALESDASALNNLFSLVSLKADASQISTQLATIDTQITTINNTKALQSDVSNALQTLQSQINLKADASSVNSQINEVILSNQKPGSILSLSAAQQLAIDYNSLRQIKPSKLSTTLKYYGSLDYNYNYEQIACSKNGKYILASYPNNDAFRVPELSINLGKFTPVTLPDTSGYFYNVNVAMSGTGQYQIITRYDNPGTPGLYTNSAWKSQDYGSTWTKISKQWIATNSSPYMSSSFSISDTSGTTLIPNMPFTGASLSNNGQYQIVTSNIYDNVSFTTNILDRLCANAWLSNDYGNTWRVINVKIPTNKEVTSYKGDSNNTVTSCMSSNGQYQYVMINTGLHVSSDYGNTFYSANDTLANNGYGTLQMNSTTLTQNYYNYNYTPTTFSIRVFLSVSCSSDGKFVTIITKDQIFYSNDYAKSFYVVYKENGNFSGNVGNGTSEYTGYAPAYGTVATNNFWQGSPEGGFNKCIMTSDGKAQFVFHKNQPADLSQRSSISYAINTDMNDSSGGIFKKNWYFFPNMGYQNNDFYDITSCAYAEDQGFLYYTVSRQDLQTRKGIYRIPLFNKKYITNSPYNPETGTMFYFLEDSAFKVYMNEKWY